jgi:quercetin dioxygenase-like cupin family protein
VHVVLILRGRGRVLLGDEVREIEEHDSLYIPPQTWHQFYAAADSFLGFLCLVRGERDRPSRPTEEELAELCAIPAVKNVIRY